jgi:hypothetical protein
MLDKLLGACTGTFSIEEVAQVFEVSESQVIMWLQNGTLSARQILGTTRVDYDVVRKFADDEVVRTITDYAMIVRKQNKARQVAKDYTNPYTY